MLRPNTVASPDVGAISPDSCESVVLLPGVIDDDVWWFVGWDMNIIEV